mgnify:CR=1 FL=1
MHLFGNHSRTPLYVVVAALLFFSTGGAFNRLVAQGDNEAAQPAPANEANEGGATSDEKAEATPPKTFGSEIFKWPESTAEWVGVFFYLVLFVFSMVAAMVAAERLFNLKMENVAPRAFTQRLQEMVRRRDDSPAALGRLAESSDTPIARVLKAAAFRAGRPWSEVEKGMDDEMAWEMAALRGRHRALSVVGSVAPLVGLLGTVIGMIFAFMVTSDGQAQAQAVGSQAAQLGKGIYMALLTTAAGLTIAIPCLLLASRFNAQVERYMRAMNESLLVTMPGFVRLEQEQRELNSGESMADSTSDDDARVPVTAK